MRLEDEALAKALWLTRELQDGRGRPQRALRRCWRVKGLITISRALPPLGALVLLVPLLVDELRLAKHHGRTQKCCSVLFSSMEQLVDAHGMTY